MYHRAERASASDRLGELVTTTRPEEAGLEELWQLSCEMRGHEDDIKGPQKRFASVVI